MVTLYDHQNKAISKMKDGCVLAGGVGSGKTMTALGYYVMAHHKKDLYVITTAKKRDSLDWQREAAMWAIGPTRDTTSTGTITVDSWNNISKYVDVSNAFFVFDEQRLVGSGSWVKSFLKIAKRNSWILLSATPADTWLDYIPVFVANGFYKNRTEFKLEHVVYSSYTKYPKVERYLGTKILIKNRDKILVEMPYQKKTTRNLTMRSASYDKELFDRTMKMRWNPYTDEPIKNISELMAVLRRVTNTSQDRLDLVRTAVSESKKVVCFYNCNHELERLRGLGELLEGVTTAEWNGQKHQDVPTTDSWLYLVQYTAGAEGWNCVTTDRMVFYSLTYSYRQFEQAQGRIDRLNTPFFDLKYDILTSQSPLDLAIWKALRRKQDFQPASFLSSNL